MINIKEGFDSTRKFTSLSGYQNMSRYILSWKPGTLFGR